MQIDFISKNFNINKTEFLTSKCNLENIRNKEQTEHKDPYPCWINYSVFKPNVFISDDIVDLSPDSIYVIKEPKYSAKQQKLFPGITEYDNINSLDKKDYPQLIVFDKYGLRNQVSRYARYTIFGTSSPEYKNARLNGNAFKTDFIDIHINIDTKECYQCFYVAYDSGNIYLIN